MRDPTKLCQCPEPQKVGTPNTGMYCGKCGWDLPPPGIPLTSNTPKSSRSKDSSESPRSSKNRSPRREYNRSIKALQKAGLKLAQAKESYDLARRRAFDARDILNESIAKSLKVRK